MIQANENLLKHFKTEKCIQTHNPSQYPSYFKCQNYHSQYDRRRNPYLDDGTLVYKEIFIHNSKDYRQCINLIEYFYHPKVYKTIQCKLQNCQKLYKHCPYFHSNQQRLINTENLTFNLQQTAITIKQIDCSIQKLKNLYEQSNIPTTSKDSQLTIQKSLRQKIEKTKEQLKLKVANRIQTQKLEKEVFKKSNNEHNNNASTNKIAQESKNQSQQPSNNKDNNNPLQQFNYFMYGEQLNIIEDRRHEFKIFRDFNINDLVFLIMKYITGFLNSEGGTLYLGIDDSSYVYGIKMTQKQFDKIMIGIDADGKTLTIPPLFPQKYRVKRIPVYNNNNYQLYVIEIKVFKNKNSSILTTYNKQCYMRMNASTHRLTISDYIHYQKLNKSNQLELSKQQLKDMDIEELKDLKDRMMVLLEKIDGVINSKI